MEDQQRVLAGRYRLIRPLGQGGMGEVWEARDESLHRHVAVKVISALAGGGSQADEARARFLREARITAALQHPNIVTVHDLGEGTTEEGPTPFLVMELLRGRGLDETVRVGPADPADVARWGALVCDALAEAHSAGILHRDIKPANLFLTTQGGLKVLDFGIARAAEPQSGDGQLTRTGFMVGTAAYMAPEQARGRPEARSDLYSLGCVLFELLTGQLPFTAPDVIGYLTAHLQDPAPAPSGARPGIPAHWDELILRLLSKDPSPRYASATTLAAELRLPAGPAPATGTSSREEASAREPGGREQGYTPTSVAPEGQRTVTAPANATEVDAPHATRTPDGPQTPQAPAARAAPALSRRSLLGGAAGLAAVAVAGGSATVYLTGGPDRGPVVWSRKITGAEKLTVQGTAASGGRCYVTTGSNYRHEAAIHAFALSDGRPLWKALLGALWNGSTDERYRVVGGTVLAVTAGSDASRSRLHALDTATGKPRWGRDVPGNDLVVHRPSGLLINGDDGLLAGSDPRTGSSRWTLDVSSPYDAAFVQAGNLLLCDRGQAVNAKRGNVAWERPELPVTGELGHVLGDRLLCHEREQDGIGLVCRRAGTGSVVWRTRFRDHEGDLDTRVLRPVAALVSGTTVLMPPTKSRPKPVALDAHTGRKKWTYDGSHLPDLSGVTSTGQGFVVPTQAGAVHLDAEDGRERWREQGAGTRASSAGRHVVLHRTTKERVFQRWTTVRVLTAESGREDWKGQLDAPGMSGVSATGDGRILLLDGSGTLCAVRT